MPLVNPAIKNIEQIIYNPGLPDSGDLEPATRVITATSEANGLANADYSVSLTLPIPEDSRLVLEALACQIQVAIDSLGAANRLNCRLYIDAQDNDHLLIDVQGLTWNSTGTKITGDTFSLANKPSIFNLLKDGLAHTFHFFFWANNSSGPTISLVRLFERLGNYGTSGGKILSLNFKGEVQISGFLGRVGTGNPTLDIYQNTTDKSLSILSTTTASGGIAVIGESGQKENRFLCADTLAIYLTGSVSSDLNYIKAINFTLRS